MLRRLTLGFAGVVTAAIAIAACSSPDATQTLSVGPSFPPQTLYAANVTTNTIGIYTPVPKSTTGPVFAIGGSNTTLSGPQFLAFDSSDNLWVTNWLSSTTTGTLLEFASQATGNVLPFQTLSLGTIRPRGVASFDYTFSGATSATTLVVVAEVDPFGAAGYSSSIGFYERSDLVGAFETVAGPSTRLNVPSGVAVDSNHNVYVSNLGGSSVEVFAFPTPTAAPTSSATASPTASPTATASATAAPTASPLDIPPIATISGAATGIGQPTGLALDSSGKIYVVDQASTICSPKCPAILIFPAGSNGGVTPTSIHGSNTLLLAPTDIKVDKSGNIYIADEAKGAGVVYVYAAGSSGNVAPMATLNSPGSLIGLGLIP